MVQDEYNFNKKDESWNITTSWVKFYDTFTPLTCTDALDWKSSNAFAHYPEAPWALCQASSLSLKILKNPRGLDRISTAPGFNDGPKIFRIASNTRWKYLNLFETLFNDHNIILFGAIEALSCLKSLESLGNFI